MDGWQQDWVKMLETLANDMDRFFQDVAKEMSDATDAFMEFSEDIAEHLHEAIAPELDKFDEQIDEWVEPILQAIAGIESAFTQASQPVSQTVEPILNHHPVCTGCRHYHGQSYNGVMFICAMHPYGMEDGIDSCPDKEAITWLPHSTGFESDDDF
ncbi:MAG TPA: hypothetical protein V6C78_33160 [Crinalium sp.]|jgi:hypothetical protein